MKEIIKYLLIILIVTLIIFASIGFYMENEDDSNDFNSLGHTVFEDEVIDIPASTLNKTSTRNYSKSKDIDFSRIDIGLADVRFDTNITDKIKLTIENDRKRYIYNLKNEEEYVAFPLQMGNGKYDMKIYQNTSGKKYRKIYSESTSLNLKDSNIVYLNSMQQIEWYNDDTAVEFANALVEEYKQEKIKKLETSEQGDSMKSQGLQRDVYPQYEMNGIEIREAEIIELMYSYVVENIDYDYEKIKGLNYDYIPDIDVILKDGSGICYDYSVLLAAMLRSQGVHVKLVKGYSQFTDVYHAWNEIYLSDRGEWVVVDTTFDAYRHLKNYSYSFEKKREDYEVKYEY